MQKKGLGRGLEALIPNFSPGLGAPLIVEDEQNVLLQNIPVSKIVPNPNQPRKHFDDEALADLAVSVKEHGLLQPVVVRAVGAIFELVVGERRWRAAREAGLMQVPAIIKNTSDVEAVELAIIENVQRQDLNALEEANAYRRLVEDFGFSQEQLAERIGKSRSAVANTLRLLNLPESVMGYVLDGKITAGHARAILSLPREDTQIRLAERIVSDGLSVRQAEAIAKLWQSPSPREPVQPAPLHHKSMARSISKKLSAKVRIKAKGEKGRLEIHFKSEDELKRIFTSLTGEEAADLMI